MLVNKSNEAPSFRTERTSRLYLTKVSNFMELFSDLSNFQDLSKLKINNKIYRTRKEFEPEAYFCFSFGVGEEYNNIIAKNLLDAIKHFGEKPIFVQTEIGDELKKAGFNKFYFFGNKYGDGESSLLLPKVSTYDVFLEFNKQLNFLKINPRRVLYLVHQAHAKRVIEIGKKLKIFGQPFLEDKISLWPRNDPQYFVRGKYVYMIREFLTRIHHTIKGWA